MKPPGLGLICASIQITILAVSIAAVLLGTGQAFGQQCPRGAIDVAGLTARMEATKEANVIFRAAAIAGQAVVPTLRKLSIPKMSSETVSGAAQASLAKLGDEATLAELESELDGNGFRYSVWAMNKLLIVNNPRSISTILAFLDAHPGPIMLGCATDACYDYVPQVFKAIADIVENAPIKTNGKYRGSRDDWVNWWKQGKPIPFSISGDFQDPYMQCLGRKVEWGFDMAIVDLGATGDQRAVPEIKKLGTMGYPYGYDTTMWKRRWRNWAMPTSLRSSFTNFRPTPFKQRSSRCKLLAAKKQCLHYWRQALIPLSPCSIRLCSNPCRRWCKILPCHPTQIQPPRIFTNGKRGGRKTKTLPGSSKCPRTSEIAVLFWIEIRSTSKMSSEQCPSPSKLP
jgi:hypothetical protein